MRVGRASVYAAALCLFLAGCGSGTNIMYGSGLEGSYTGAYQIVNGSAIENGTLALVISTDGKTAGSMVDSATSKALTLTGEVRDDRHIEATVVSPAGTFTLNGTLAMTEGNRLVGVLTRTSSTGASAGTFTIDCVLKE